MANLLDRASIVLTPTAYNNGEALCIKPDDGSGDFQFSRNSAATRVNAQGLVENVQILSSNLVQNGDFSEEGVQEVSNGSFSQEGSEEITNGDFENGSTGWALNGWTISNGKANCNGITANLIQSNVGSANKTFKLVFTISNYISGKVIPSFVGLSNESLEYNANGTYTTYISSLTDLRFVFYGNLFNGSIDNVSVREVGQDWTFTSGATLTDIGAKITHTPTAGSIAQLSVLTIGKQYKLTYEITESISGGLKFNSAVDASMVTTVGVHTKYFEADGTTAVIGRTSATDNDVTITNISVKEVGQNWALVNATIGNDLVLLNADSANAQITQSNLGSTNSTAKLITFTTLSSSDEVSQILRISQNIAGSGVNIYTDDNGVNLSAIGVHKVTIPKDTSANDILFVRLNSGANRVVSLSNFSVIEITTDTSLPRINYEGFSYQDALGSELIVNGDFDTDSDWSKGSGWSISGGTANTDGTPSSEIRQNNVTTVGKQYKYSFTISNSGGGVFNARLRNKSTGTPILNFSNEGTYSGTFTSNGTFIDFVTLSNNTASFSIDNVSVKEYLGQEVVPDSGCGSWLWEPQSTNLITQSNDLSQWIIQQNATVSSPTFVSPSGENNANLIDLSADTDARVVLNFGSASTEYTFSVYLKKHESDVNGTFPLAYYNGSNYIKTYVNLTDKWQRFSLTFTNPSGSVFGYGLSRRGTTSDETLTRCYAWGGQQEALSYPTSLIPTEGSSVTRNQDVCTNGSSLASINSTEGVLYAEIARSEEENLYRLLGIDDGTSNNYVKMGFENSRGAFWIRAVINGVTSISSDNALTSNPNEFYKIAIRYQSGNSAIYINGTSVLTTTTTFSSGNFTALDFNHWNNSLNFFGKTKAVAVWKEALSDQELTELTTI